MVALNLGSCRNFILRRLPANVLAALGPHLQPIEMLRGKVLIHAGQPIEQVIFPDSGICSLVLSFADNRQGEIGIVGREGLSDGAVLAGVDHLPYDTIVQVPGTAWTMRPDIFVEHCGLWPELRHAVMQFGHVMSIQVAQTAVTNATYNVEERLARWLLMVHDRMEGDEIDLTHDFLSTMLSVRRSTVTLSTHILEGAGMIRATRGRITIRDREALIGLADGSYGIAEREYQRLIGPLRQVPAP